MPIITEPAFILLTIIAYGVFFYGIISKGKTKEQKQQKVIIFTISCMFLLLTAALSTPVNNQIIGLLNFGLALLAVALIIVYSAGVLPDV
jgi:hypothetical protein